MSTQQDTIDTLPPSINDCEEREKLQAFGQTAQGYAAHRERQAKYNADRAEKRAANAAPVAAERS